MTGEEAYENLKNLDLAAIYSESIKENAEFIADLNAAQLAKGLRTDGDYITPEYRPLTVEIKSGKTGLAAVTSHVTLYDTGAHYEGLYAAVKGEEVEYGSKDIKSLQLQAKYDGDQRKSEPSSIYGLTEDSKEDLILGGLQSSFQRMVEEDTGLKFD